MTWPKAVLFVAACVAGGFGLGCLLAATLGRCLWREVA